MALYPVFKMVMKSIKTSMHAMRLAGERHIIQPDYVDKVAYHYALDDNHECNIYRRNDEPSENKPLVIDIHGGCWIYGDKDYYDAFSYELVDHGMNVSSLTYSTSAHSLLKEQVEDIFQYWHFLKYNEKHLGISLDHVMLTGDSAGAQLSLLCYAINKDPVLQEIFGVEPVDIHFDCLVLTHPVCFIDTAAAVLDNKFVTRHISIPGLKRMLYGIGYEFKPEYQRSVTPDRYITEKIDLPPVMIVTSKGDSCFLSQSEKLADFFDEKNIPYHYYYESNPDAGHVYNISYPFSEDAKECNIQIRKFFEGAMEFARRKTETAEGSAVVKA